MPVAESGKNIVLIGMPGSGKTTFGKILAKKLGMKFIDADSEIIKDSGKTIKELFEVSEEFFRDAESKTVKRLAAGKGFVLAMGGGVVKRWENIEELRKNGTIIFIDRNPDDIVGGVRCDTRPLLKDGADRIYSLYEERKDLYAKAADVIVKNKDFSKTVGKLLREAKNAIGGKAAKKHLLVLNGPNINMLGIREPNIYGKNTYADLCALCEKTAKELDIDLTLKQSNYEGELVTIIQQAYGIYDGIVINPAAYTHTSIAILDALKAVAIPAIEVHITAISERESFRHISYPAMACIEQIAGLGFEGYAVAMRKLANL